MLFFLFAVLICMLTDFCCCMLLVYYLSVIVCFSLWKTVSVKIGGQLDKRMLHWQPAKCCIFQLTVHYYLLIGE